MQLQNFNDTAPITNSSLEATLFSRKKIFILDRKRVFYRKTFLRANFFWIISFRKVKIWVSEAEEILRYVK